ncbi:MAG: hypothetical protein HYW25_04495 [Candidatus Aenigmarchaeota archaeon]|nr:hypothetical protein [Candidatus Aenigmarchaeota archaeon]
MAVKWDWYVHGLWILGALFAFFGVLLAGNLAWIEGTNIVSFTLSVIISFLLILVAGLMWISAGANAVQHELDPPASDAREQLVHVHKEEFNRKHVQEEKPSRRHFMDRRSGYIKF